MFFQITKCDLADVDSCPFCSTNVPRLPEEQYAALNVRPDPLLDRVTGKYKDYHRVLGIDTTDADMSYKLEKPGPTDRDKQFKSLLIMVAGAEAGVGWIKYIRKINITSQYVMYMCIHRK